MTKPQTPKRFKRNSEGVSVMEQLTKQETIIIEDNYLGNFKTPDDCLEYTKGTVGVCGQASIASLLDKNIKDIFDLWGKNPKEFRHFSSQKEMKEILLKCGFVAKQKSIGKNKVAIPDIDFGIIRVSYGDRNQHWMETAKRSHYIGIRKMPDGRRYIFDNGFGNFNEKPVNGLWVEVSEYWVKVAMVEKMFVTSYLELQKVGK